MNQHWICHFKDCNPFEKNKTLIIIKPFSCFSRFWSCILFGFSCDIWWKFNAIVFSFLQWKKLSFKKFLYFKSFCFSLRMFHLKLAFFQNYSINYFALVTMYRLNIPTRLYDPTPCKLALSSRICFSTIIFKSRTSSSRLWGEWSTWFLMTELIDSALLLDHIACFSSCIRANLRTGIIIILREMLLL